MFSANKNCIRITAIHDAIFSIGLLHHTCENVCYRHEFLIYTTFISLLLPLYYTNIFTQNFADSRFNLDPMGKMWSRAEEIKGKKGEGRKRGEGEERENSTLHHDNKLNYHWLRNAPEGNYRSDNTEELHESNISRATDGKSEKI